MIRCGWHAGVFRWVCSKKEATALGLWVLSDHFQPWELKETGCLLTYGPCDTWTHQLGSSLLLSGKWLTSNWVLSNVWLNNFLLSIENLFHLLCECIWLIMGTWTSWEGFRGLWVQKGKKYDHLTILAIWRNRKSSISMQATYLPTLFL